MMKFILAIALFHNAFITDAYKCIGSDLDCPNGYQCVEGKKDYSSFNIFSNTMLNELPWFELDNIMNQHCDCGEKSIVPGGGNGMTGIGCTVMFQICPDDTVCFHGAPCVEVRTPGVQLTDYVCDCNMTIYPQGEIFLGEHCEYKCDLDCFNGGICAYGVQNNDNRTPELMDHFKGYSHSDMYCICPKGLTGPQCETKTSGCGSTECLNGGNCEKPIISGEDEYFYCDCQKASTSLNDKETNFAGTHCQSASTMSCDAPAGFNSQDFFCTNNGVCPENYWDPCLCPGGYSGPRCEFLVQHHKYCSLECMNGGTCFHGHQTQSVYDLDGINDKTESNTHVNMHCKCPIGFIGTQCDTSMVICNGYDEYCLNGGKCVSSGDKYVCECPSEGLSAYAGIRCEYAATSICGDTPGSFCTNDGMCIDIVSGKSEHPGCTCVDGFHGHNCELLSGQKIDIEVVVEDIMWVYLVILSIISSIFLYLICVKIRKNRLEQLSTTRAYLPGQEVMHDVQLT